MLHRPSVRMLLLKTQFIMQIAINRLYGHINLLSYAARGMFHKVLQCVTNAVIFSAGQCITQHMYYCISMLGHGRLCLGQQSE